MAGFIKHIIALFAVLAVLVMTVQSAPRSPPAICGPNEEYASCGSACAPKCNQKEQLFCTAQCVVGCQCISGYLRKANGQCVKPKNC